MVQVVSPSAFYVVKKEVRAKVKTRRNPHDTLISSRCRQCRYFCWFCWRRRCSHCPTRKTTTIVGIPTRKRTTIVGTPTRKRTTIEEIPTRKRMTIEEIPTRKKMAIAEIPSNHCPTSRPLIRGSTPWFHQTPLLRRRRYTPRDRPQCPPALTVVHDVVFAHENIFGDRTKQPRQSLLGGRWRRASSHIKPSMILNFLEVEGFLPFSFQKFLKRLTRPSAMDLEECPRLLWKKACHALVNPRPYGG